MTPWLITVATTWSGRVFGDLWPATIFSFIMAEAHQVHQRDIRDDQNVTLLMSFFLTEGNKKILIHKEKSCFPFSATAHRDFKIFKKAVLDFCGVQSLAEAKGLGRSIDCSFLELWRVFVLTFKLSLFFFVNCERTILFSVKCDLDPPFTTLLLMRW